MTYLAVFLAGAAVGVLLQGWLTIYLVRQARLELRRD